MIARVLEMLWPSQVYASKLPPSAVTQIAVDHANIFLCASIGKMEKYLCLKESDVVILDGDVEIDNNDGSDDSVQGEE